MSENTGRKMKPAVRMIDLARMAGVSKSTVSRALSDNPLVSKETREQIQALAREHNYRLNVSARNFFLKETLTIAVLIPTANKTDWRILDPFFLELLGNIADALNDEGHELLLAKTSSQSVNWIEDYIKGKRSDGVILIGQGIEHEKINELSKSFAPLVVWGGALAGQKYCTVGSDNIRGGRIATEHLLSLGRRKLAFLGDKRLPEVALRYEGFCQAHAEAGVAHDASREIDIPFTSEAAFDATTALLKSHADLDGIIASSDVIAMSAIRAIKQSGLSVPEDISVVGYDDIMLSSHYNPELTTIRQNCREGGRYLVKRLLQIIAGEKAPSVLLPTELVVRNSCGAKTAS